MSTRTAHREVKGRKDKHHWGQSKGSQLPSALKKEPGEQNPGSLETACGRNAPERKGTISNAGHLLFSIKINEEEAFSLSLAYLEKLLLLTSHPKASFQLRSLIVKRCEETGKLFLN